ncbi:hypothetical protein GCM10028864_58570 [Microlunatus parietis]|nr:hypothetical protein [Microlunatus parietis]
MVNRRDRGVGAVAVGGFATAAVIILARWLRTRTGQRRYREFVARMDEAAALAQQQALEAAHLIKDKAGDLADAIRDAGEHPHHHGVRTG